ncbi:unnamed protein product, partial [Fusarium langsethiae]
DAFAKAGDMHAAKQLAKREETLRHAINHKAALEALIQLVTVRNLSYNCSSWPELHALISAVNPAADDLISLSHGSIQKLVSNSFRVHKDMLRRKLQSTPWKLHLSADVWSAPNHKAFLGICVKFVDPDAKEALQALLALSELPGLDGPGSHGGAEQWKLLQQVLEDYNIWNKVGFYTGDNHGSNDKLCRLLANYLQEKGVDWEAKTRRIRCHGHIVNLAVQAFLFIDSKEAARAALEHIEDTDESAFGTDFSERIKPQRAQGWRRLGPLGKVHNISIHMRENDYRWSMDRKHEEEQQQTYPRLSRMAVDILSIPAMSAEPERVFSGARRTISWDRCQLGSRTIERDLLEAEGIEDNNVEGLDDSAGWQSSNPDSV